MLGGERKWFVNKLIIAISPSGPCHFTVVGSVVVGEVRGGEGVAATKVLVAVNGGNAMVQ